MKYMLPCLTFFAVTILSAPPPSIEDIKQLQELKIGEEISEDLEFTEIQTSTVKTEEDECEPEEQCIYGYDLFNKSPTTFALSSTVAVPANYLLGPGDQVKIEYFGNENLTEELYINRSGLIKLPLLGPINLGGLTLEQATKNIKSKVSQELIGTEVILLMGELRAINVYLLGEAFKPGTYTVGSLSSVTNVLFSSGGVSKIGSLRGIEIKRQGKVIGKYDFYDFLLSGDTSGDVRLQDGDTIFIPLIQNKVLLDGAVLRNGYFELKNEETIESILPLAGMKSNYSRTIEHSSFDVNLNKRVSEVYSIELASQIKIRNGDVINVLDNSAAKINTIQLGGEFNFPGVYSINDGDKLGDIIQRAGGLTSQAYIEGAVFTRKSIADIEKESYLKNADTLERSLINSVSEGTTLDGAAYSAISGLIEKLRTIEPVGRQVITVDPFILKSDPRLNITLQDGDSLFIPKRTDSISVVGEVLNPVTHIYNQELTLNDYIDLSGGLTDGADLDKIFIINPNGQAVLFQNKLFLKTAGSSLLPGSTIVVSRDTEPFDWLKLTTVVTPILSDLAVSAAAIAAISDNN